MARCRNGLSWQTRTAQTNIREPPVLESVRQRQPDTPDACDAGAAGQSQFERRIRFPKGLSCLLRRPGRRREGKKAMASEEPRQGEERGRVLPFTPRRGPARPNIRLVEPKETPVEDLAKYAAPDDEDDYPHRMKTNAAAAVFVLVLVLCGYWLADTLAEMRRNQDCVLSGRPGCTKVTVPIPQR